MLKLAVFASGNGSNAQRIIEHFAGNPVITICLLLCNKPGAYVLTRAANLNIPAVVFDRSDFYETGAIQTLLEKHEIDYLVLAGFLWLIPVALINRYPGKIVNIHPALLPKYGGKGMYGMRVHEAVIASGDTESGITIHEVNQHYDEGNIIFQAKCNIVAGETPDSLAEKIHMLEYKYYPEVIEGFVTRDA